MKLAGVVKQAEAYYKHRSSGRVMVQRVRSCAEALGVRRDADKMTSQDGTVLIGKLIEQGLSRSSVKAYYSAFTTMLRNCGCLPSFWPRTPSVPRQKRREAFPEDQFEEVLRSLTDTRKRETADLALLMRHTGMRAEVDALSPGSWTLTYGEEYDTLVIISKGEHERTVPIVDPSTRELLRDSKRLRAMWGIAYSTHSRRWRKAVAVAGVNTKLPTLHSLRHAYANHVDRKSGRNLRLVQQLLGHSDVRTTTTYLDDMSTDDAAKALL